MSIPEQHKCHGLQKGNRFLGVKKSEDNFEYDPNPTVKKKQRYKPYQKTENYDNIEKNYNVYDNSIKDNTKIKLNEMFKSRWNLHLLNKILIVINIMFILYLLYTFIPTWNINNMIENITFQNNSLHTDRSLLTGLPELQEAQIISSENTVIPPNIDYSELVELVHNKINLDCAPLLGH